MNIWRTRKIRNGRVKIDHVWFYPSDFHREYKGELDGETYVFGRYAIGNEWQPYVSMWGSKKLAEAEPEQMDMSQEKHITDGYISWEWWYPK